MFASLIWLMREKKEISEYQSHHAQFKRIQKELVVTSTLHNKCVSCDNTFNWWSVGEITVKLRHQTGTQHNAPNIRTYIMTYGTWFSILCVCACVYVFMLAGTFLSCHWYKQLKLTWKLCWCHNGTLWCVIGLHGALTHSKNYLEMHPHLQHKTKLRLWSINIPI